MVAEEVELLARTTLQKVRLVVELEDPLPQVLGERGTLASGLMNLCVNAVDAMPRGGTLTLRTRAVPQGLVEVQVEDTGEGMSEAVLARALEPFFTTKPMGRGTGMGLSMAYATLKAHGGSLAIASTPGRGTRVTLLLPTVAGAVAPPAHPEAVPRVAAFSRILLVDDDPLIQATVPDLIETLGHRVAIATSGREALARLEAGDACDLVILDLNMPDLNGAETLKGIRRLRPGLPVLLATGFLDAATGAQLQLDGRALCLLKPFSRDNLAQKLLELEALLK
jgi:CheY-like chemotaxis protein